MAMFPMIMNIELHRSQNEKSNAIFYTYKCRQIQEKFASLSTKMTKFLAHLDFGFSITYSIGILQQNKSLLRLIGVLFEYVKILTLFVNPVGGMDGRSVTKLAKVNSEVPRLNVP
jgi:hypothetical protein